MMALGLTLLMVGGVALEVNSSGEGQPNDCSCIESIIQTQDQQAGWFWGKHCKNGVERYRVFGIGFGRGKACCATYQ